MPLYSYLLSSNLTSFFYTAINTLFWGSARGCPGSTCISPVWLDRCHTLFRRLAGTDVTLIYLSIHCSDDDDSLAWFLDGVLPGVVSGPVCFQDPSRDVLAAPASAPLDWNFSLPLFGKV